MQKRRIQAVNRPIDEEMLQRDFETFVDAARSRMAERKPSQLQLKIRGLIQQDWNVMFHILLVSKGLNVHVNELFHAK